MLLRTDYWSFIRQWLPWSQRKQQQDEALPTARPVFMTHERWGDVLFLHWRVPKSMEALLQEHAAPFQLERDSKTDSVWIGLILLTEHGIQPNSYFWPRNVSMTHHGANVRTYVRPYKKVQQNTNNNNDDNNDDGLAHEQRHSHPPGIHFASLECDHGLITLIASLMGVPYKLARMERTFYDNDQDEGSNKKDSSNTNDNKLNRKIHRYHFKTQRISTRTGVWILSWPWRVFGKPLYRRFVGWVLGVSRGILLDDDDDDDRPLHSTRWEKMTDPRETASCDSQQPKVDNVENSHSRIHNDGRSNQGKEDAGTTGVRNGEGSFSIECQWEVLKNTTSGNVTHPETRASDSSLPHPSFWTERYHAYTTLIGIKNPNCAWSCWRGTIHHEPWPRIGKNESAKLTLLQIKNIHEYEPSRLQPLLRHMADTPPDSVEFSPAGVGPIEFDPLQPIAVGSVAGKPP